MQGPLPSLLIFEHLRNFIDQVATCVMEGITEPWPQCKFDEIRHSMNIVITGEILVWVCAVHDFTVPLGALAKNSIE